MATCTCGIGNSHARTAPSDCPEHQVQTHKGPAALASSGPQRRPRDGNSRTAPIIDLTELVSRLEAAALEASDLSVVLARASRAEMDRAGLMADLADVLKGGGR